MFNVISDMVHLSNTYSVAGGNLPRCKRETYQMDTDSIKHKHNSRVEIVKKSHLPLVPAPT